MSLTKKQVDYVAHLSRLELPDPEKDKLAQQLGHILDSIDKLNELDTEGVSPLVHLGPRKNVLRQDSSRDSLPADEALQNAPKSTEACFSVPKIID